ncbi:MAG: hypothetical protein NXH73_07245 [Flavobacteriaceae bacterium]|nr:hypothetical protein [Flavobacteriaceae bacterium]
MDHSDKNPVDFQKMKIGVLVRSTLPELLQKELISKLEIEKLQKEDYSKINFDVNYPVLKKVDKSKSLIENRRVNDYTRYYAKPVKSFGDDYLITSEWYEGSLNNYINWLKRRTNKS